MSDGQVILDVVKGRKVGTFFSETKPTGPAPDLQATKARDGGRLLQSLTADEVGGFNIIHVIIVRLLSVAGHFLF